MTRLNMFFLTLLLTFTVLIFPVFVSAVTLTQSFSASDKPKGPTPAFYPKDSNNKKYDPTTAQIFSFRLTANLTEVSYYTVTAELSRSEYPGFAANFPEKGDKDSKKYKDLMFLRSDYEKVVNRQKTFPWGWKWKSDTELEYIIKTNVLNPTVPAKIMVRCYDWGANGSVTVTVKKSTGWFTSTEIGSDTKSIPMDTNNNLIADGWANDATKNWVASEDEESFPNRNPQGDGWSVYAEYRGLFLKPTDRDITRLDPTQKEVFVCSSSALASYGRGLVKIPHHAWHTIHEDLVNSPWSTVRWKKDRTKIDPKVDKSIGELNFNAKGIPGDDKRAWAIRMTFSTINPGPFGDVATGSPSYSSKILIHKVSIEKWVEKTFRNFKVGFKDNQGNYTQDFLDAMDVVINVTISHELGHCLAVPHCTHAGCVMRDGKVHDYDFDPKTKDLTHDVTGIDAAHDNTYSATGVVGLVISSFYVSVPEATDDSDDNEVGQDSSPSPTPSPTPTPTPSYSLVSSDGVYTAEAGTGHEANFTAQQAYRLIYWYVKGPGDFSYYGPKVKTDYGDGSTTTTAQLGYSFPSGVSGEYQFLAYVYSGDYSVYETSYTVSVSLPSQSKSAAVPSGKLSADIGSSLRFSGVFTPTLKLTTTVPVVSVKWYTLSPGNADESLLSTQTFSSGVSETTFRLYIGNDVGDYTVRTEITSATGVVFNVSCIVTRLE